MPDDIPVMPLTIEDPINTTTRETRAEQIDLAQLAADYDQVIDGLLQPTVLPVPNQVQMPNNDTVDVAAYTIQNGPRVQFMRRNVDGNYEHVGETIPVTTNPYGINLGEITKKERVEAFAELFGAVPTKPAPTQEEPEFQRTPEPAKQETKSKKPERPKNWISKMPSIGKHMTLSRLNFERRSAQTLNTWLDDETLLILKTDYANNIIYTREISSRGVIVYNFTTEEVFYAVRGTQSDKYHLASSIANQETTQLLTALLEKGLVKWINNLDLLNCATSFLTLYNTNSMRA